MTTFTPPVLQNQGPLLSYPCTPLQRRLYRYMRPIDLVCNVFIHSDGTVATDYGVPILPTSQNGEATVSSTAIQLPWYPEAGTVGPPEGAEGGPYGPPVPYATIADATSGVLVNTTYALTTYVRYWFRGGIKYPNLSANLVTLLTNAGYAGYLT